MGPMPYGITWLLMPPRRSHIIHHDQSGFSRPNTRGKGIITRNNIHNVVNVNEAINVFKVLGKAINVFKAIMESIK